MTTLILAQDQVKAVYNAMCTFNAIGACLDVVLPQPAGRKLSVTMYYNGTVIINLMRANAISDQREYYHSKSAFAGAYGLSDLPPLPRIQ